LKGKKGHMVVLNPEKLIPRTIRCMRQTA
jgi:hypothetical protein